MSDGTSAIVPPTERLPEAMNKPISDDTPSRDLQPAAQASLRYGEPQPEPRERWRAAEYGEHYEDLEVPEGSTHVRR